jgi:hypothetical protein
MTHFNLMKKGQSPPIVGRPWIFKPGELQSLHHNLRLDDLGKSSKTLPALKQLVKSEGEKLGLVASDSTLRRAVLNLCPEKVKKTKTSTVDRNKALNDPYTQISMVVAWRNAMGYLTSTSELGRDVGQKPLRSIQKVTNIDGSGFTMGEVKDFRFDCLVTEGASAAMRHNGMNIARGTNEDMESLTRRGSSCFIQTKNDRMISHLDIISDHKFNPTLLTVHKTRVPSCSTDLFICRVGDDVTKGDLAKFLMKKVFYPQALNSSMENEQIQVHRVGTSNNDIVEMGMGPANDDMPELVPAYQRLLMCQDGESKYLNGLLELMIVTNDVDHLGNAGGSTAWRQHCDKISFSGDKRLEYPSRSL